ncbi:MAG: DUF2336 domain-containing protein [Alphaproteobacteria bacterium]|nr:MAG: DUF2336 domain-containing protein [Alphaproteobacteria bacterium]
MSNFHENVETETARDQAEAKAGPIKRGKSAIMSLLAMIEGSRERDTKTWVRIFETVSEFRYSGDPELEQKDLVVLDVILHSLLPKVTVRHRRGFAERISRLSETSQILIESLITDELTVAAPILARSKSISEPHYKAAISRGTAQHRCVIAGRPDLTAQVIEDLLEFGDVKTFSVLLHNNKVILSEKQFLKILDHYLGDESREEEVLEGSHLTMSLAYQSYWQWTPASRMNLLKRFPMNSDAFGQVLDGHVRSRGEHNGASHALKAAIALHDRLSAVRQKGFTLVLDDMSVQHLVEFMLNGLCIGKRSIKRIFADPSGFSLAIFFNALGLRASQFKDVYSLICHQDSNWESHSNNLQSAADSFDVIDSEVAGNLISVWCFGDVRSMSDRQQEIAA